MSTIFLLQFFLKLTKPFLKIFYRFILFTYNPAQDLASSTYHITIERGLYFGQGILQARNLQAIETLFFHLIKQVNQLSFCCFNRSLILLPCFITCFSNLFFCFFLYSREFLGSRYPIFNQPLTELYITIKLLFPFQTFTTFIAFVRARSRVSLWLGELCNMYQRRHMLGTCQVTCLGIRIHQCRVVPALDGIYLKPLVIKISLEALERLRDTFLNCMIGRRYRNPIIIVPYTHHHRYL